METDPTRMGIPFAHKLLHFLAPFLLVVLPLTNVTLQTQTVAAAGSPGGTATSTPATSATSTATATPTPGAGTATVPILVTFRASVSDADKDSTVHSTGGQSVRDLKQIHTRVINVPANVADRLVAAYAKLSSVQHAARTVKLTKASVPNDPGYPQQWALPKISWDQAYGSVAIGGSAKIAVLDTGVDASHPDLSGVMTAGQSEVGGDPNSDPNGHGTELAGIAAASVNNGLGMAGVAYQGASISSVRVLGSDGTGYDSDVVAGVLWAADNGANVILMGFSSPTYSSALADAVSYAESKGVVVVAATGNDGSTAPTYPAGLPGVIGVASTDQNDNVTASSNIGSAAVAAPGVGIYATQPGGGYGDVSGTSPAAAEVAGLAALLVANGVSASQTANQIKGATAPVSGESFGRIDVARALGAAVTPVATATPVTATPTPAGTPVYQTASVADVSGHIYDVSTGNPISGAVVTCPTTGKYPCNALTTATADANGAYAFNKSNGNQLNFSKVGPVQLCATAGGHSGQVTVLQTLNGNQTVFNVDFYLSTGSTGCNGQPTGPPPTQLAFATPPRTFAAGAKSGVITVQLEDAQGNPITPNTSSGVTVNLTSSSGTGTFYDSTGTTQLTSPATVTIPAGSSTASFTYSDTAGGRPTITASSSGLTSATQQETVNVSTTTTITSSSPNNTSVYGQSVTFTATVADVAPGTGTPTGTIQFAVDGTLSGSPVTLTNGSATFTTSSLTATSHTITATYSGATGFLAGAPANLTQTVNKATLTVTANNASRAYGAANPTFTAGYSGFQNGETLATSGVTGSPSLTTTATSSSPVGTYTITAAQGTLAAANYTFSFVSGTLTVTKATLTVTADNNTKTYGAAIPSLTYTITGFQNGDTAASATTGTPSLSTTATASSGVGSYAITVTQGTLVSSNYSFSFVNGSLTVTPATLTVTASSSSMTYGATVPAITASYSGFVNGDTQSVLSGSPSCTTTATSSSPVGTYPTSCSQGTLSATNYSFSFVNGTLTVTKGTPTITWANPADVSYGTALSSTQLNATASVPGTFAYSPAAGTVLNAGSGQTLSVTFTPTDATDYTTATKSVTINVTKATLTVTCNNQSMTYGGTVPSLSYTITGFVNGDTSSVVSGSASCSATATSSSPAGTYTITPNVSGLSAGNYTFQGANGTLTVNPASLTVKVTASGTYGSAPNLSGLAPTNSELHYTGFVNGDSSSVVSGTLTCSTTATSSSSVGSYPITGCSGLSASNYTMSYDPTSSYQVTPATLTVTAGSPSMTYGGTVPTITAGYGDFVNGDTQSVLTGSPSCSTTATSTSSVGTYPTSCTQGSLSATNYTFSFVGGTLTVNARSLTIAADSKSMTYGGTAPTFTFTTSGLVNGDSLTTNPTCGAKDGSNSPVSSSTPAGTYTITCSSASAGSNYTIGYTPGTLTIGKAQLTVTCDNQSMTYGGTVPSLTYTITGFVNGDTTSVISGSAGCSTSATSSSSVGSYAITPDASKLTAGNYTFQVTNGTLAVDKAVLTVTAEDKSMTYGGTMPNLNSATYSGFKNGDMQSVVSGTLSCTSSATAHSPVGGYSIDCSGSSLSAGNYTFSFQSGTLTINPASLTITADNQTMTYGGTLPPLTWKATGFVNGDTGASLTTQPSCSTVPASSHAGSYAITCSGAVDANYTISYGSGTLTINPAALTVTANNQTMAYGGSLPAFTWTGTGFVNGDTSSSLTTQPTCSSVAGVGSHVGAYSITCSGAADPDYTISYASGTLTVTAVSLAIKADDQSMIYGGSLPALTWTGTGFVNGDTSTTLSTAPNTPPLCSTVPAGSHAGTYDITCNGATDSDYAISYAKGTLTVTRASLTITADNQTMTYGGAQPSLTWTANFVNGDTAQSLAAQPTCASVAANSGVGIYAITCSGAADPNYIISYANGTLTINAASLTIKADDQSMVYGGTLPSLTWTASFVNGDTATSLTTQPTCSTASASSHVGKYDITCAGAADANYTISYEKGQLSITPAALTITADDQSITYGGSLPTLSWTASFVNGDTGSALSSQPTCHTAAVGSHAGSYAITCSGAVDPDYTISYTKGMLTITPAALTITADNQTMTYGGTQPNFTWTANFVNGDTPTSLSTQPICSSVAASSHTGSYAITCSGAVDPDYTISYANGTFTIKAVPLTITADDQSMTYGSASLPAFSASYSGFVNGDTAASLKTQPACSTAATTSSHQGTYTITCAGAEDPDYSISYVNGTLTINPAALTITADDKSMTYGGTLPVLTMTYTGLVNGDTADTFSHAPDAAPTCSTVPATSHQGTYAITCSGAVDPDYTISYVKGTLTINPAALTITADNKTKVYGEDNPALTWTPAGLVNGDTASTLGTSPNTAPTCASLATKSSHFGSYAITCSGAVDHDYTISYVNGTLTINPAALTITADSKSMSYGGTLPALTWTATGLVNGDTVVTLGTAPNTVPTCSTAAASSHVGSYLISCSGASDADYAISYTDGTLTINPAALTITADSKSMTYGGAMPMLTWTPSGLVNGDSAGTFNHAPNAAPSCSTVPASSHRGTYDITCSGAVDADYAISYVKGTLTINPAALTITADNQTMSYGGTMPALTWTPSGLVNGDTAATLGSASNTAPFCSTVPAGSHAGSYAITCSGAADPDYTISYAKGTLTITPAALTITADNQMMAYGSSLPNLTVSYSGLVNGDTADTLKAPGNTAPTCSTATVNSHVGSYAIICSAAVDPDYTISYVNGTLTINPAPLTITADDKSMAYGGAMPALTVSYSGLVNGDTPGTLKAVGNTSPTCSTAPASSHVGSYDITCSGAVDNDYLISYVKGTLTITPAALTITAESTSMVYSGSMPSLTWTSTGLVNGDTAATLGAAPNTAPTCTTVAANSHTGSYAITCSGAVDNDYTITYVKGMLTINPAALTIVADSKSMRYGGSLPALTWTANFANGDTPDVFKATGNTAPSCGTTDASSHAGTYAIVCSGAVDPDYSISYANGTLTIISAALTIAADNQSMTYGGAMPSLTVTYTGLVNGDTPATFSTAPNSAPSCQTVPASSHAGTYDITCSGAVDVDYTVTYVKGTLTINSAALTVTADNKTKVYGAALPTLTVSYTGFVNGDTASSLTMQPTIVTAATTTSHQGTYSITASGAVDHDYTISYVSGTLTVISAALTITADDQSMTYGGTLPALTWTPSGLVNGDTKATVFNSPNTAPTCSTVPATSHQGRYDITCSGAVDADYTISYVKGTLTINPAALTITADNKTMTYGGTMPTLTVTYTGLVNGDTAATFSTAPNKTPTCSTAAANSHAGTYVIACSGASNPDYAITNVNGQLTINPATLTIAANNQTMVYGGTMPALTVTYTGLVNSDTAATLGVAPNKAPTCSTVPASSHAGSYAITCSGAVDADYTISYQKGTLSVTPAPLTIAADTKSMTYGGTMPNLTFTPMGLVNGDTSASLTTQPTLSTTATAASHVGTYPITASGAVDADYTISYVAGTLTVATATLTMTTNPATKVYGNLNPTFSVSYSGFVNGDSSGSLGGTLTFTTSASQTSPVGSYSVTPAGPSSNDYTISFVAGTLTVTKAVLTVSADNKSMTYLGAMPAFTTSITGFKNADTVSTATSGSASCNTTATATSLVGTYPITCTQGTLASTNYSFTFVAGTLSIVYRFDGWLQPINDTAHTQTCGTPCPLSVFKAGSTVPAKFVLKDANGNVLVPGPNATMPQWVAPMDAGPINTPVDETVYTDTPSSGGSFSWNGSQYQYNWKSPSSGAGRQFRIAAKLDDGEVVYVYIGLK